MNNGKILARSLAKLSRKQQRLREHFTGRKMYFLFIGNVYLKHYSVTQTFTKLRPRRACRSSCKVPKTVVRLANLTKTPP